QCPEWNFYGIHPVCLFINPGDEPEIIGVTTFLDDAENLNPMVGFQRLNFHPLLPPSLRDAKLVVTFGEFEAREPQKAAELAAITWDAVFVVPNDVEGGLRAKVDGLHCSSPLPTAS